ncbi:hypothetical protein ACX9R5_07560 [Rathayibacter sp. CAU 1779]
MTAGTTAAVSAADGRVLCIVRRRRWRRVVLRCFGIPLIVLGCFPLLVVITDADGSTEPGSAIATVIVLGLGLLLTWRAHAISRWRLEAAPDEIRVFRSLRRPRRVPLDEMTELAPSAFRRGIVVRSATERLFAADHRMLGYSQLLDYLSARRPDLDIPRSATGGGTHGYDRRRSPASHARH